MRFSMVDVFSPQPLGGNPLAVVHDAGALDHDRMLALTRWFNLSETAFLLPPTDPSADYRVRIFTLAGELPFAGHPTLGAAHAWLASGGQPRDAGTVVQECGAGLVPVRRSSEGLAFAAPPLQRSGPLAPDDLDRVVAALGIDHDDVLASAWVDNGPGWMAVRLASAEQVLALRPAASQPAKLDIGVVGPLPPDSDEAVEVRAFFVDEHLQLREDPVTGSLNASLAQWLLAEGVVTAPYTARQGTVLGRTGRPRITTDGEGRVWVGGPTTTVVEGALTV